ncbi:hypothetical protein ACHAWF_004427 [Thalassiosira exigua]
MTTMASLRLIILIIAFVLFDSSIAFPPHRSFARRGIDNHLRPRVGSRQLIAEVGGPVDEDIWSVSPPVRIEGKSLKTWAFPSGASKRVQVSIKSLGRPTEASVELWQTPSYTPTKFTVECEDGSENVFHSTIELPEGHPVTVAVYNTECQQFPMEVSVADVGHLESASSTFQGHRPQYIEGGKAVKSYTFGYGVESVEVFLTTKMRNMKAYIEILQGPNDDNEIIEVETDNASIHPFYTVIQTPEGANTLRIVNDNSLEFPLEAYVRSFETVSDEAKQDFNYGGPYF